MTSIQFKNVRLEATCFRPDQLIPEELPEIAIAGRSNVGKSSLINALLNVKLAKTGKTPGKTRSINFYRVDTSEGVSFRLVDLPGYGYAARSADERNDWQRLITAYVRSREALRLVMHLVDFRHGLMKNDRELQEWVRSAGKSIFVVFTKADKIARGKWKSTREGYVRDGLYSYDVPVITSSESREGVDALREFVVKFLKDSAIIADNSQEMR
ncbi:MAG: YihA family ribosome biogenesis GTP-binding protein [Synergistaceae bacterium]|nr:YihA family ribosome biogenesis GTP-binding protein [Synergistaceae bacterium]